MWLNVLKSDIRGSNLIINTNTIIRLILITLLILLLSSRVALNVNAKALHVKLFTPHRKGLR